MKRITISGLLFWHLSRFLSATDRTSVILITVDTLRADHLEAYGYEYGKTPATTAFAQDSVLFKNVIVQIPITLPSHASILTGTYPFYHGVQDSVARLREGVLTLAEWFKTKGYATGAVQGSAVLPADYGLNRGFDVYDDNFTFSRILQQDSSLPPEKPALTDRLVSLVKRAGRGPQHHSAQESGLGVSEERKLRRSSPPGTDPGINGS